MLGINQSAHMTNEQLYAQTYSRPIADIIRERQLQFTGHCLRMDTNEPTNIYALYNGSGTTSHRRGAPKRSYISQIATHICPQRVLKLSAIDIQGYAKKKEAWSKIIAVPKQLAR
jgi:hypothetical protein